MDMNQNMSQNMNQNMNQPIPRVQQGHPAEAAWTNPPQMHQPEIGSAPQINQAVNSVPPKKKEKKEKKKKGGFKKVMSLILAGLLVGAVAGCAFYGTIYAATFFDPLGKTLVAMGVLDESDIERDDENKIDDVETVPEVSTPNVETTKTVTDVSAIADRVMPALVSIVNEYTATEDYGFFGSYEQTYNASGSGIIVGQSEDELLLVTNYHVVEDANSLMITFVDNATANATVKGSAKTMDLAVIAVSLDDLSAETKDAIAIATLGDSDTLKVGEPAIAIGNALGYGQSVTTGCISALDREIEVDSNYETEGTFIQTDAAINPGNSGGALLNMKGEVIGINSSKIGGSAIEGMGYAIPISAAKPIIDNLLENADRPVIAEKNRGYLGVTVTNAADYMYAEDVPKGALIDKVNKDSAADRAGLMSGDIITKFGTDDILSLTDLQDALCYYKKGETITVVVQRKDKYGEYGEVSVQVTLQDKPAQ